MRTGTRTACGALITGLSILCAACGPAGSSGTADAPPSGQGQLQQRVRQNQLDYARCMRSHGLPSFPDPSGPDPFGQSALQAAGINAQSPAYQAAQQACQPDLRQGFTHAQPDSAQLLAFAECVREHGYPNFPDPAVVNGSTVIDWASVGLSMGSPQAQNLIRVCHGALSGRSGNGA